MKTQKIRDLVLLISSFATVSLSLAAQSQQLCPGECIVPCLELGLSNQQVPSIFKPNRCLERCGCTKEQADSQLQAALDAHDQLTAHESLANANFLSLASMSSVVGSYDAPALRIIQDTYCKTRETVIDDKSILSTQLSITGLDKQCNIQCVKDCYMRSMSASYSCYGECNCLTQLSQSGQQPWTVTPLNFSPDTNKVPDQINAIGFGQVWNNTGCTWEWKEKPVINVVPPAAYAVPTICPFPGKETVCVPNENGTYGEITGDRLQKMRIAAITITRFFVETQYLSIAPQVGRLDITNERQVLPIEVLIQVALNVNNLANLVKVEALPSSQNAFQVTYAHQGQIYSYFVLITGMISATQYKTIVLKLSDVSHIQNFVVSQFDDRNTLTGKYWNAAVDASSTTDSKPIDDFKGRVNNSVTMEKNVIFAAASGAQAYHLAANQVFLIWRVDVLDFNDYESKLRVYGFVYLADAEQVQITYDITVRDHQQQGAFVVIIYRQHDTQLFRYISFDILVENIPNSANLNSAVYYDGNAIVAFTGNMTFSREDWIVKLQQFWPMSSGLQNQENNFLPSREQTELLKESNAALAALTEFLKLHPYSLVDLVNNAYNGHVALIDVRGPQTWNSFIRQIEWNNKDNLYNLHLTYPNKHEASFYAIVTPVKENDFIVSIMNHGVPLITYYVIIDPLVKTNIVKIIEVRPFPTPAKHTDDILDYTELVGGKNKTSTITVNVIGGDILSITGAYAWDKPVNYIIYNNPNNGQYFWLFSHNNTVLNGTSPNQGQIISLNGGLSVIIQLIKETTPAALSQGYHILNNTSNGQLYKLWANNSIVEIPSGKLITNNGVAGFVTVGGPQIVQIQRQYKVVIDLPSGDKYYIFDDDVFTPIGYQVCKGQNCIYEILYGDSDNIQPGVNIIAPYTKPHQEVVQVFTDPQGAIIKLNPDSTFLFVPSTSPQYVFPNKTQFMNTLTPLRQESVNKDVIFQTIEVQPSGQLYLIHPDGRAFQSPSMTQVSIGALPGLIRYLTAIALTIPNIKGDDIKFESANLFYRYKSATPHHFVQVIGGVEQSTKICEYPTKDAAFNCFYNFLAINDYNQLRAPLDQQKGEFPLIHIQPNGNQYINFPTGKVTDLAGNLICRTGGQQCLLDTLYGPTNQPQTLNLVVQGPSIIVQIPVGVILYYTPYRQPIYLFPNGTYVNALTNQIIVKPTQTLYFIKEVTFNETIPVTVVRVPGTNLIFYIKPNGDVYTPNNAFITTGGIQGLITYLNVQMQVQIWMVGPNIVIPGQNIGFKYDLNPQSISTIPGGEKICISSIDQQLISCLINYLNNTHSNLYPQPSRPDGSLVVPTPTYPKYEIFIYLNIVYYIYPNGEVKYPGGYIILPSGGKPALIEWLNRPENQGNQPHIPEGPIPTVPGSLTPLKPGVLTLQPIQPGQLTIPSVQPGGLTLLPGGLTLPPGHSIEIKPFKPSIIVLPSGNQTIQVFIDPTNNNVWWLANNGTLINTNTSQIIIDGTSKLPNLIYNQTIYLLFPVPPTSPSYIIIPMFRPVQNVSLTHTVYKDIWGNTIILLPGDTRLYNVTLGQTITFTQTVINTLIKIETKPIQYIYALHTLTNITYIINPEGIVFTQKEGHLVTTGGLTGLIRFLEIYYVIIGHNNGRTITFAVLNLTFNYNRVNHYISTQDGKLLCSHETKEENFYCIHHYLYQNYFNNQILIPGKPNIIIPPQPTGIILVPTFPALTLSPGGQNIILVPTAAPLTLRPQPTGNIVIPTAAPLTLQPQTTGSLVIPTSGPLTLSPQTTGNLVIPTAAPLTLSPQTTGTGIQIPTLVPITLAPITTGSLVIPTAAPLTLQPQTTRPIVIPPVSTTSGALTFPPMTWAPLTMPPTGSGGIIIMPTLPPINIPTGTPFPPIVIPTTAAPTTQRPTQPAQTTPAPTVPGGQIVVPVATPPSIIYINITEATSLNPLNYQIITINNNQIIFFLYPNGTVTHSNGTIITTTGGYTYLVTYITTVYKVTITSITYANWINVYNPQTGFYFRLYNSTQMVTHQNGTVICPTGGIPCLQQWLLEYVRRNYYEIAITSDGRRFAIYYYGQVIDMQTNQVICVSAPVGQGLQCLIDYLGSLQPTHIITVNGVAYQIWRNGSTTSQGVVITQGGVSGFQIWITQYLTPQYQTVNYGTTVYYIHNNGSVYDSQYRYLTNGGVQGLQTYIQQTSYQQVNVEGTIYYLYGNGTVTTSTFVFVTNGGIQGLQTYIQSQQAQQVNVGGVIYLLYSNGTVTTQRGVFVTTGGVPGLQQWLQDQLPTPVNVSGTIYNVYKNGSVYTQSGTYVTTGGIDGLKAYIALTTYQTVTAGSTIYRVYGNGTVTTSTGVFVTLGGVQGLQTYITSTSYQTVQAGNDKYHVYSNGSVYLNGVFVVSGGVKGLQDYITAQSFSTIISGKDKYRLYSNGTVTTDAGVFVTTGGQEGLQAYLQSKQHQVVQVGPDQYFLYSDGRVTTSAGVEVTKKGMTGLQEYLNAQQYSTLTYAGVEYRVYGDNRVTGKNGVELSKNGGQTFLMDYIQKLQQGQVLFNSGSENFLSAENNQVSTSQQTQLLMIVAVIMSLGLIALVGVGLLNKFKQYKEVQNEKKETQQTLKEKLLIPETQISF